MAGVGKMLKQIQKMQTQLQQVQEELEAMEITVGGACAVTVKVNGAGKLLSMDLDPEFLREDPQMVSELIVNTIKDALAQADAKREEMTSQITQGLPMPKGF